MTKTRFFDTRHDRLRLRHGVMRGAMVKLDEQLTDPAEPAAGAQVVENLVLRAFDIELEHITLIPTDSCQHLIEGSRCDVQFDATFDVGM